MTPNSLYILIIILVVIVLITLGLIERFSEVSPRRFFFGVFYIAVGLLLGSLLSVPLSNLPKPYGNWLPIGATILIVIIISAVLWRKHDVMDKWVTDTVKQITHLRIPGLTAGPQVLGELVVDTSVLIDGRITDIVGTGFMPYRLVIPRFVLAELQNIADSTDSDRRARGRRGLDAVDKLRKEKEIKTEIVSEDFPNIDAVDAKLVALAKKHRAGLLTTDYNLNKRAKADDVKVLNINELSQSLRPVILPGEELDVKVVHTGKEKGQGVGYMPDGTMIVVEKGDKLIEKTVHVKITRALQTAAGKMFFAKVTNGNNPEVNVNLAKYTTFQIGGDADLFYQARNKDDLVEALNWAKEKDLNFQVIGGGSNILVSDKGYRGLIILNRQGDYVLNNERVVADAGANLSKIARETVAMGLKGLEFATGIPGTSGAAAVGNAGAYGKQMSDVVLAAGVWHDGKIVHYLNDDFEYGYKFSRLKSDGNRTLLSVTIKLERGNIDEMKELANFDVGKRTHDYAGRNAGSYFVNIPVDELTEEQANKFVNFIEKGRLCVGKMIDNLGLKGLRAGNAMVSENHANVIQNLGGATASEVIDLERTIIDKVLVAYGIILRSEVVKLGEF